MSFLPMAAAVGSTIVGAVGAKNAGKEKASSLNQQAAQNVQLAEYNATNIENTAQYNVDVLDTATKYNIASATAATDFNLKIMEAGNNFAIDQMLENSRILDTIARDSINRGANAAAQERAVARKTNATARASFAAAGTSAGSGTALDVQAENVRTGSVNALTVMNNAEREAYGYKSKASDLRKQVESTQYGMQLEALAATRNLYTSNQATEFNSEIEKDGLLYSAAVDAANLRASAAVGVSTAGYEASIAKKAGNIDAITTLLSGGSKIAGSFSVPKAGAK